MPWAKHNEVWTMNCRLSAFWAAPLLCSSVLLSACNSAESDWNRATAANTVAAYQSFVEAHPHDAHAADAQAKMAQLQDDSAWQQAQATATSDGYQAYLKQFPKGAHVAAATDAMSAIDRAAVWKQDQAVGTVAALQSFLQKYPTGPEADQATAKLKELTRFRVHLAIESTDAKAERKVSQLNARLKDSSLALRVTESPDGKSYSIDTADMSEQDATNACARIQTKHQSCQVVNH